MRIFQILFFLFILNFSGSTQVTDTSITKTMEGIYQCEYGGTHFLILKTIKGKLYGTYIGTENQTQYISDSNKKVTYYYAADLQALEFSNDNDIYFSIIPGNLYSRPILMDQKGNVTFPIQLMKNKTDLPLTYRFSGKITGEIIDLKRVADHYFGRFDELIFSKKK